MVYRLLPYGLSYRRFKQARGYSGWFTVLALIIVLAVLFIPRIQLNSSPHRVTTRDYEKFMQYREQNTHRADARKYLEAKSKGKFDIWKEAAETGIPSGQALLGLCYFDGISVPQDKTVAMEWLCKAAIQGCTIPAYPFMEMENENFHEHQ